MSDDDAPRRFPERPWPGKKPRSEPPERADRSPRPDSPHRTPRPDSPHRTARPDRPHRPTKPRAAAPPIPDDVTPADLDREVRAELRSLSKERADDVARHLVMAGALIDDDPETAYQHAQAARGGAGRVAAVREAAGLTAYNTGRYAEALAELRAARRISGDPSHLPLLADAERGLGRPERALAFATDPDAQKLDEAGRVELRIVLAGARRDLGQPQAALLLLEGPDLDPDQVELWTLRLWYAYADALLDVGRTDEAKAYLTAVATADEEGETDAAERLSQLDV
jgi:tetratricopeptide (TPR) repeat protein